MPRHEFEARQGLIEDTVKRQAASLSKAILEGIMNSVDANATEIMISMTENEVTISDDGDGIPKGEVQEVFRKFGRRENAGEGKTFGEFSIGRGQMFNYGVNIWHTGDRLLVVNIRGNTARVHEDYVGDDDDDTIIDRDSSHYIVDTSGLGFVELDAQGFYDGTHVTIDLYDKLEEVNNEESDVRDLTQYVGWANDVEIMINGSPVKDHFEPDHEDDLAWYEVNEEMFYTKIGLYNQGAHVKDLTQFPVSGTIITKDALTLTMDRKQVVDDDPNYDQIVENYTDLVYDYLMDKQEMSVSKSEWLIGECAKRDELDGEIAGKQIFKDIKGGKWTLSSLNNTDVVFAPPGDRVAKEEMRRGGVVALEEKYERHFDTIIQQGESQEEQLEKMGIDPKDYKEFLETNASFEMRPVDESELSKRRMDNLLRVRWFFTQLGDSTNIEPGHSQSRDVWRNEAGEVFLDRSFLNSGKRNFIISCIPRVARQVYRSEDTRAGEDQGYINSNKADALLERMGELQMKLLDGKVDL